MSALPPDGKPVTSWPNQDDAWTAVATGVRFGVMDALKEARNRQEEIVAAQQIFAEISENARRTAAARREAMQRLQELIFKVEDIETGPPAIRPRDKYFDAMDAYIKGSDKGPG